MNYDLSRIDYTICGITYPDTLKILPSPSTTGLQKFAIGDKAGVLQCLSIKDEEPVVQFKSLPGKPITSVQLASTSGSPSDKIFAASGNEVKGYTKKGKVFLTIETTLSETITSMFIYGGDLILGSGRVVTHYRDLKEFHSYNCDDRVLDVAAFGSPNSTRLRLLVLVANKGAVVLENGQVAARMSVPCGPSRLAVPPWLHNSDVCAYYGAADGSIGLIAYVESVLTCKSLVDKGSLGAVVCVGWFTMNSAMHLVVGRHDGSIQLYLIDMENLYELPRLKYTYFCGEPITSVAGGCVGTEEGELVAATFSGRIFALRSSRLITGANSLSNISQDALASRRSKLEIEVARLEKQAASERDKYQKSTRSSLAGLSAPPLLDLQCELSGAKNDGWQEARVTSAVPLDMLFLYCQRKLDLLTDSAAVLSICPSQGSSEDLLATVRCQAGTRRLWIRMRLAQGSNSQPLIGQSTKLLVYALPAGAPRVARLISLQLPAFPYYSLHDDPDTADDSGRSWCVLRVTGSFSVAEMTSWLTEALPGDLPRPSTSMAFARSHTLIKTILICRYQRGLATFKSDNISTIYQLKDILSNCSVVKGIRVDITCDVPEDCCKQCFESIEETFKVEFKKYQDMKLLEAMSALDLDANAANEEIPILCEDYLKVLRAPADDVETSFEELVGTIVNWFRDYYKIKLHGADNSYEIDQLKKHLNECNLEAAKKILSNKTMTPVEAENFY
ncbi:Bardet-Biedl syndrome 7 protein homolog [Plutella xylostella]|uniref:Bardet-Biedl syndrome 7 protein homolog n=1 Tax=Plutella xylostella TaxID=51655 RepID=UPI0020321B7E|nr:Bardet-Biedl syndrome 7 protein homolog [Plutella xylostella]